MFSQRQKTNILTGICLVVKSFSFNELSVSLSMACNCVFKRGMFDLVCSMLALTPPRASPESFIEKILNIGLSSTTFQWIECILFSLILVHEGYWQTYICMKFNATANATSLQKVYIYNKSQCKSFFCLKIFYFDTVTLLLFPKYPYQISIPETTFPSVDASQLMRCKIGIKHGPTNGDEDILACSSRVQLICFDI